MSVSARRLLAALELILLAALVAVACACQHRGAAFQPIPHVIAPIQGTAYAIDQSLGRAMAASLAALAVALFAVAFVAIEARPLLRIALAAAAGCGLTTVGMIGLRLVVPVIAVAMPWFLGATVLAGLASGVLWYTHGGDKLKLLRPKVPVPPTPAPPPPPKV